VQLVSYYKSLSTRFLHQSSFVLYLIYLLHLFIMINLRWDNALYSRLCFLMQGEFLDNCRRNSFIAWQLPLSYTNSIHYEFLSCSFSIRSSRMVFTPNGIIISTTIFQIFMYLKISFEYLLLVICQSYNSLVININPQFLNQDDQNKLVDFIIQLNYMRNNHSNT